MTDSALNKDDEEHEKFFFNVNIFDEDHVDEVEEEAPPPPVFSEADMIAARRKAFDEGKAQGVSEQQASRAEQTAQTLNHVSGTVAQLIQGENTRRRVFEEEVIALSAAIFKKLFPVYEEKTGFDELIHALQTIIQSQHAQIEISVFVHPDALEGVEEALSQLTASGLNTRFIVQSDDTLPIGTSKASWTDGGAVIDRQEITGEILSIVQGMLAGGLVKSDDMEPSEAIVEDAIEGIKGAEGDNINKDNTLAQKNDTIEQDSSKSGET